MESDHKKVAQPLEREGKLREVTGWQKSGSLGAVVLGLLVPVALPACAQQAKRAEKPLATMVDRVLSGSGKDTQLPPHLANEFGLTPGLEIVAVKQVAYLVKRMDVIAFNVSIKNHADIVIFRETEMARTYFLTSPAGALRKVIQSTRVSADSDEIKTRELRISEAKVQFEKEKRCREHAGKTSLLSSECFFAAN